MNNGTLGEQLAIPGSATDAVGQKWAAGLNDIKDLYEKGYFPVNTLTATDAETVQLFAEGEAAFLIDGSWKINYFVDNYGDQLSDYAISYVPAKGSGMPAKPSAASPWATSSPRRPGTTPPSRLLPWSSSST